MLVAGVGKPFSPCDIDVRNIGNDRCREHVGPMPRVLSDPLALRRRPRSWNHIARCRLIEPV